MAGVREERGPKASWYAQRRRQKSESGSLGEGQMCKGGWKDKGKPTFSSGRPIGVLMDAMIEANCVSSEILLGSERSVRAWKSSEVGNGMLRCRKEEGGGLDSGGGSGGGSWLVWSSAECPVMP